MISNSRLPFSNTAFGSAPQPDNRATDSYSNSLMDDLFGDVDRILGGDLGDCMTVVDHEPQPVASHPARTVQLPSDFSPRSAMDIYQATVAADRSTSANHQTGYRSRYQAGGRPVTADQVGRSPAGNLQSSVIQSPIYSSSGASGQNANTATIDIKAPPIQSVSNYLYPLGADADFSFESTSPRPQQTIFEPKRRVSLPFLMMGAAGVSVVSTLGLWTASVAADSDWISPLNTEAAAAEMPADSDTDFLAYMQKALETIGASQLGGNQAVAVIPVAAPALLPTTVPNVNPVSATGALPNLPSLPNPLAAAADKPSIIERVFVPIYQNGQSQNAAANSTPAKATAALPPIALASANNVRRRPTVPVPEPVATAAALPPGAPTTGISSIPIVPVGSRSLPSPGVDLAVGSSAGSPAALNDVTPSSELVLVGVLNLGNRSAALFDIDGSSQRAYVGDRIGLSNWNLVSVNGQDVVIRRNDEVRSVYIGQRF